MRRINHEIRNKIFLISCSIILGIILHPASAFAASAYTNYDSSLPETVVTEPLNIVSSDSIGLDAKSGGKISSSYDIAVSGDRSYGAHADTGGIITIDGNIKTSGDLSTTMYVGKGSIAYIEGDISMYGNGKANNTLGWRSFSLYADSGEVTVGGNVTTSGDNSTALYAKDSTVTVYGTVSADGNGSENQTIGNGSHGINAVNSVINVSGDVLTSGVNNFGVNVTNNCNVTVDGEIFTQGLRSQGVNSGYGGVVTVGGDITSIGGNNIAINAAHDTIVNALGNVTAIDDLYLATGIHAVSGSKVNVSGDITAKGTEFGNGIEAFDEGTIVTVGGNVSAEAEKWVRTIDAKNTVVNVSGDVSAKGAPTEAFIIGEAIFAYDKALVTIDGNVEAEGRYLIGAFDTDYATITIGGNVSVSGDETWGVFSYANASIGVAGSVSAAGGDTTGAYAYDNAVVTIGKDLTAEGSDATGLWATKNGTINVAGDVDVSGDKSYGAYVTNASEVSVGGNVTVNGTYGVYANQSKANIGGDIVVDGSGARGAYITSSSELSVDGKVSVNGASAYGVYANASKVHVGGGITAEGNATRGVHAVTGSTVDVTGDINVIGTSSYGVYAASQSTLTVKDSAMHSEGASSVLIRAENSVVSLDNVAGSVEGLALIYTASGSDVFVENGSSLVGDVINRNASNVGAVLNLSLDGASTLTGTINDEAANAKTNFALTTKDDIWYVTGTSKIKGSLDNSGVVDFMPSPIFTDVTVGYLGANGGIGGTFVMKADVENETADNLVVTQITDGSYKIAVNNNGGGATTGEELTTLVRTADQGGHFELAHDVEVGAWSYGLRQVSYAAGDAIWELYATDSSNPGSDVVNAFYASYLLGYANMETLIKRLGDLRDTRDESGVWARVHGGKFEKNAGSYAKAFDMKYWGIHVGYDRKLEYKGWKGDNYVGVFFGWGKGDVDYLSAGSGEVESREAGIYGTWIHPNGFYADLVFKYQWLDNDFRAIDSAGDLVLGSGANTGGFGGSLELGQRVHFSARTESDPKIGWYIEPQVQLSIMRYSGDNFHISNGMTAGADGFTSIIGRLGALVGYENEAKNSNFYLKAFRLREFEADINVYINGSRFNTPYKGSWWVYGAGYTGKIDDQNSIYLDIERTSEAHFKQLWSARLGWRYAF